MQINKKIEDGKMMLSLSGRLDTNTSPDLEAEMNLEGINEVAFDLANLEYISSAGLRVLMTVQKSMIACGGRMTVANPNSTVRDVFDITGLSSVFTIV